ncbi:hypothetical protein DFS34DRAFT_715420 [Phlyctochytrium arcticum]|nr:hypothetical protein DFS34DRAFT_715420 [Phlyctochytrium arcticum]
MRFAIFGGVSAALTVAVIANAWLQRGQFFTACIHLTRSSASLMVLLNMGLCLTILFGRGLQRLFFGELRALEVEHLYERSWFAVTETCLAMTVFRDEFDVRFIVLFVLLLLVKLFHWIAQDRVDFMEQAPNPSTGWHIRMQSITVILAAIDLAMVAYAVQYSKAHGPTMMIIFGFEYTILLSLILTTFVKYLLHSYDLRRERPWEEKSIYIFYVDLLHDLEKLITYICFFGIVVYYYSLPLHIVRDLYMTLRSFLHRCRHLIQYRRATANMNERYPDATAEELGVTDRVCIICREEMEPPVVVPQQPQPQAEAGRPAAAPAAGAGTRPPGHPDTPKKLHCGHIFHFHCLRSWLERQQSCPTCRRSVLDQRKLYTILLPFFSKLIVFLVAQPAATAAAARPPAAAGVPGNAVNEFQAFWQQHQAQFAGGIFNPRAAPADPQQQQQQQPAGRNQQPPPAAGTTTTVPPQPSSASSSSAYPGFQFPQSTTIPTIPTMMYPMTLTPLVPLSSTHPIPPVLDHFTDEQVRAMEGDSRAAVLERIRAVQSVQNQLAGVVTQLVQVLQVFPTGSTTTTNGEEASGSVGSSIPGSSRQGTEEVHDRKGKGVVVVEDE